MSTDSKADNLFQFPSCFGAAFKSSESSGQPFFMGTVVSKSFFSYTTRSVNGCKFWESTSLQPYARKPVFCLTSREISNNFSNVRRLNQLFVAFLASVNHSFKCQLSSNTNLCSHTKYVWLIWVIWFLTKKRFSVLKFMQILQTLNCMKLYKMYSVCFCVSVYSCKFVMMFNYITTKIAIIISITCFDLFCKAWVLKKPFF